MIFPDKRTIIKKTNRYFFDLHGEGAISYRKPDPLNPRGAPDSPGPLCINWFVAQTLTHQTKDIKAQLKQFSFWEIYSEGLLSSLHSLQLCVLCKCLTI